MEKAADGKCESLHEERCLLTKDSPFTDCTKHEMFWCPRCDRVVSWDFGCADDAPALCDDCWRALFGDDDPEVSRDATTLRTINRINELKKRVK